MSLKRIRWLAFLCCVGLTLASWLGFWWTETSFSEALLEGDPVGQQVVQGVLLGALVSGVGMVPALLARWLLPYRVLVLRVLREVGPHPLDLVWVSLSAGWGEELFFRGFLQPQVGVLLAALLFSLMHGMVSLSSWRVNLYGLAILAAGLGLGWLCNEKGLLAAMSAHASADLTTLGVFYLWTKRQTSPADETVWGQGNPPPLGPKESEE